MSKYGENISDSSWETPPNVILGVSLGRSLYSRRLFRSFGETATESGIDFAFLIGDHLHAYTYSVFHNVELAIARRKMWAMSEQVKATIRNATAQLPSNGRIFTWHGVETKAEYRTIGAVVAALYQDSPNFRAEVRKQVWSNLGSRLVGMRCHADSDRHEQTLRCLDEYVLREIPGLITVAEYMDYPILVYPGSCDLQILSKIYQGRFAQITEILPAEPKRQFVPLVDFLRSDDSPTKMHAETER